MEIILKDPKSMINLQHWGIPNIFPYQSCQQCASSCGKLEKMRKQRERENVRKKSGQKSPNDNSLTICVKPKVKEITMLLSPRQSNEWVVSFTICSWLGIEN